MAEAKTKETGSRTHRATQRGYGAGQLVEEGMIVPPGVPVSTEWMEPIKAKDRAVESAVEQGQQAKKDDVDLTALSLAALEAMAAERGIDAKQDGKKLTKPELITAIKAADNPAQ